MNQTEYEKELQSLKTLDEVQSTHPFNDDYDYIETAGHAYLIVKKSDHNFRLAKSICKYGFVGKLAVYLEEDYELDEFIRARRELIRKAGK